MEELFSSHARRDEECLTLVAKQLPFIEGDVLATTCKIVEGDTPPSYTGLGFFKNVVLTDAKVEAAK